MAVEISLGNIGSGFNRTIINDNFEAIAAAFEVSLGRDGTTPNSMNADLDMDSNDLLNVGDIQTNRIFVDGQEFVPASVSAVGDRGWSPSFAVVQDTDRRVLQLTGYVGGEGTEPTDNVGQYVGATQMEPLVANGVDIRGAQGASGAGTGDMLAAQNLADVVNAATSFDNIKQAATESATGVVELATTVEAAAGVDTTRAVTAAGVAAAIAANPTSAMVKLTEGTVSTASTLDLVLSSYTDYKHIRVVITGLRPATNSTELRLRFSSNAGSSYVTDGFGYTSGRGGTFNSDSNIAETNTTSYISIETGISNAATAAFDIDLTVYDWQTSYSTAAIGQYLRTGNFDIAIGITGGYVNTAQITNAIRFYMSSGAIAAAKYTVYGLT